MGACAPTFFVPPRIHSNEQAKKVGESDALGASGTVVAAAVAASIASATIAGASRKTPTTADSGTDPIQHDIISPSALADMDTTTTMLLDQEQYTNDFESFHVAATGAHDADSVSEEEDTAATTIPEEGEHDLATTSVADEPSTSIIEEEDTIAGTSVPEEDSTAAVSDAIDIISDAEASTDVVTASPMPPYPVAATGDANDDVETTTKDSRVNRGKAAAGDISAAAPSLSDMILEIDGVNPAPLPVAVARLVLQMERSQLDEEHALLVSKRSIEEEMQALSVSLRSGALSSEDVEKARATLVHMMSQRLDADRRLGALRSDFFRQRVFLNKLRGTVGLENVGFGSAEATSDPADPLTALAAMMQQTTTTTTMPPPPMSTADEGDREPPREMALLADKARLLGELEEQRLRIQKIRERDDERKSREAELQKLRDEAAHLGRLYEDMKSKQQHDDDGKGYREDLRGDDHTKIHDDVDRVQHATATDASGDSIVENALSIEASAAIGEESAEIVESIVVPEPSSVQEDVVEEESGILDDGDILLSVGKKTRPGSAMEIGIVTSETPPPSEPGHAFGNDYEEGDRHDGDDAGDDVSLLLAATSSDDSLEMLTQRVSSLEAELADRRRLLAKTQLQDRERTILDEMKELDAALLEVNSRRDRLLHGEHTQEERKDKDAATDVLPVATHGSNAVHGATTTDAEIPPPPSPPSPPSVATATSTSLSTSSAPPSDDNIAASSEDAQSDRAAAMIEDDDEVQEALHGEESSISEDLVASASGIEPSSVSVISSEPAAAAAETSGGGLSSDSPAEEAAGRLTSPRSSEILESTSVVTEDMCVEEASGMSIPECEGAFAERSEVTAASIEQYSSIFEDEVDANVEDGVQDMSMPPAPSTSSLDAPPEPSTHVPSVSKESAQEDPVIANVSSPKESVVVTDDNDDNDEVTASSSPPAPKHDGEDGLVGKGEQEEEEEEEESIHTDVSLIENDESVISIGGSGEHDRPLSPLGHSSRQTRDSIANDDDDGAFDSYDDDEDEDEDEDEDRLEDVLAAAEAAASTARNTERDAAGTSNDASGVTSSSNQDFAVDAEEEESSGDSSRIIVQSTPAYVSYYVEELLAFAASRGAFDGIGTGANEDIDRAFGHGGLMLDPNCGVMPLSVFEDFEQHVFELTSMQGGGREDDAAAEEEMRRTQKRMASSEQQSFNRLIFDAANDACIAALGPGGSLAFRMRGMSPHVAKNIARHVAGLSSTGGTSAGAMRLEEVLTAVEAEAREARDFTSLAAELEAVMRAEFVEEVSSSLMDEALDDAAQQMLSLSSM